jgi:uncharacterized integral membrane protein
MSLRMILSMAIVVLAIVFALQNAAPVSVMFVAWHFESSLALVLAVTFVLGALFAALLSTTASVRKSWKLSKQEHKGSELEKRVAELEQLVAAKDRRIAELDTRKDQP